jgi:hypothetical protein
MQEPFSLVGKFMIFAGVALALLGLVFVLLGKAGWAGKFLPGDIVIRRPGFTFVFPLATGLLLSAVLTILIWLLSGLRR